MKIAYNKNTGEIIACGSHIDHMASSTVALVEGYCLPNTGYIQDNSIIRYTNKQIDTYNNRPKGMFEWDIHKAEWVSSASDIEKRNIKYLEIKQMATFIDTSNIDVGGYVYTANLPTREKLIQKLLLIKLLEKEYDYFIEWYLVDGSIIDLSFYQLKDVLIAIENRSDRIFKTKKKLKEKIFSCDITALDTIRWPDFI